MYVVFNVNKTWKRKRKSAVTGNQAQGLPGLSCQCSHQWSHPTGDPQPLQYTIKCFSLDQTLHKSFDLSRWPLPGLRFNTEGYQSCAEGHVFQLIMMEERLYGGPHPVPNAWSTMVQVGQRPESKAKECTLSSIRSSFEKGLVLRVIKGPATAQDIFWSVSPKHVRFYIPSCFEGGLVGSFLALLLPLPLEGGVGGWFGEGEGHQQ